jgi:hypothetical protein
VSDLSVLVHKTDPATISAVIAVSGVLFSVLVSALISRRTNYLNAVTVERSKWIDKLRNNISECVGALGYLHFQTVLDSDFCISPERNELVKKTEVMIAVIKLQLNPNAQIDRNIIALLGALPFLAEKSDDDKYRDAEQLLIRHSQFLLKEEWEKVKYEARGPTKHLWTWPKSIRRSCQYRKFSRGEGSIAQFATAIEGA